MSELHDWGNERTWRVNPYELDTPNQRQGGQSQSKQGEDAVVVELARDEAEQLWLQGSEARSIVEGFSPEQRKKYESQAWFTGAQKLRAALDGRPTKLGKGRA